jgi:hypothetical protein
MQEAVGGQRVAEGVFNFPDKMKSWTCDVPYYEYRVTRKDWEKKGNKSLGSDIPLNAISAEIITLKQCNYNLFKIGLLAVSEYLDRSEALLSSRNKLAMEMMTTFLFCCLLKKTGSDIIGIGFPCIKEIVEGTENINLNKIVVEDLDFDTVVFKRKGKEISYFKIQIVRYVFQFNKDTTSLLKFLENKKLKKYKKDNALYLLVNIQDAMNFEYEKLNRLLLQTQVPFKRIFAIGHLGSKSSFKYLGTEIFPEVVGPITIDFGKPPPG